MSGMFYKGYTASLAINMKEGLICGKLDRISDKVEFSAGSPKDILGEFRRAVDSYLERYDLMGKEAPKPCSGNIQFRVPPSLHAAALLMSKEYGSFNKFGEYLLTKAVEEKLPGAIME